MGLLLFNWLGYRFVVNYLQQCADQQLEARIDINNYDDSQLIELRVALNIPYQAVNTSYERNYGEIEIGGKSYTYVKRKIENGNLVLKCLPNHQKEIIDNNATNFFKTTNGIDTENGKGTVPFGKVVKIFSGEFENDKPLFQFDAPVITGNLPSALIPAFIECGFITTAEKPPAAV